MKKLIAILLCVPCMASAEFMSGCTSEVTPEVTPEVTKEAFVLDRGCIAHDERDGDGVTIEAKLKEKNT